jgi:uncharacterized membrane protein YeaQ/YmgE (transglycosylase-associated protein family)
MNIAVWVITGATVGWLAFAYLQRNESRGVLLSMIIGGAGAFIGGHVLAPIFGSAVTAGDFSPFALVLAGGTAVGCVVLSDMMYERFGV